MMFRNNRAAGVAVFVLTVSRMSPAYAHGAGPVPGQSTEATELRSVLLMAVAVTVMLLFRYWREPRAWTSEGRIITTMGERNRRISRHVGRGTGVVVFGALLWLSAAGAELDPFGVSARTIAMLWLLLPLLSAVLGNVWTAVAPGLVGTSSPVAPALRASVTRTQLVALLLFLLFWFAVFSARTQKWIAVFLVVCSVVWLAGRMHATAPEV